MKISAFAILLIFSGGIFAQNSFTQSGRENNIHLQVEVREGFKRVDDRLDMMQK